MKYNQSGVREYSLETLLKIRESLARNRDSLRPDSWESQRLEAVKKEIERRMKS
jgi:predicted metallo-beta-lactamase superfamily hydrolase